LDLTSDDRFWPIHDGPGVAYNSLPGDRSCDVAIIGAGITGALVADEMSAAGLSVIVVDQRQPGLGSTSASTALLQYELDQPLHRLIKKVGQSRAVDAYRATRDGVRAIARIAGELDADVGFRALPSLYVASRKRDAKSFRTECLARRKAKLPCRLFNREAISRVVDLDSSAALWSSIGGEVDPLRLTRALLERCARRPRFEVYGRTAVDALAPAPSTVALRTGRGTVRASWVIVASGYEAGRFLARPVAKLHSTYAMVTEPLKQFRGWRRRCLIWESARPYLYIRTTSDGRIMVGGEDDPFRNPEERDARLPAKAATLLRKLRRRFPRMELQSAHAWAGTFAETRDGLPYIGSSPDVDPRILFALSYGANGMPFAAIAARLLRKQLTGESDCYADVFSFRRLATRTKA